MELQGLHPNPNLPVMHWPRAPTCGLRSLMTATHSWGRNIFYRIVGEGANNGNKQLHLHNKGYYNSIFLLLQSKENMKIIFLGINLALPIAKNSNQILTKQATSPITISRQIYLMISRSKLKKKKKVKSCIKPQLCENRHWLELLHFLTCKSRLHQQLSSCRTRSARYPQPSSSFWSGTEEKRKKIKSLSISWKSQTRNFR